MSDVEVKFGAQIDGLVAGINDAKDAIEGIAEPISGVLDSFRGLGEAAVAALAVDKVVEFTERYAELGEQIERTSLILGISTDQVQQLSFAIRMGGGDAETASLTMGIFEKNIAEAASGSGTAATAFSNMGIAVKDADGNTRSAIDVLKDIADVLSQVSDANIRAEYGRALLGRGYQNLLPVLLEGREGFDKLNAMLDQTNSKLSNDQVKALDESAKKTKELSATWDGLLIELGADSAWTGAKQDAIDLTQSMTGAAKAIGQATHALGEFVGLAEKRVEPTALNEFNAAAAKFRVKMAEIKGTGGEVFGPNLPKGIQLPSLGKDPKDGAGKDSGESDEMQIEKSDLATQEALAKIGLQQKRDIWAEEAVAHDITKQQEIAQEISFAKQNEQIELAAVDKYAALYDEDTVQYAEAQNKKKVIVAQTNEQILKLNVQAAQAQAQQLKKTQEEYKGFFDTIDRAMDGALQGILAGTQSWQQAVARIFSDLASAFTEDVAKMALKWAAFAASQSAFGKGDILTSALGQQVPSALGGSQQGGLLNSAMTKLAGIVGLNTAAHAAGTLATTGNTVATTTDAIATTTGTVATSGLTIATATNAASNVAQLGLNTVDTAVNTAAVAANTAAVSANSVGHFLPSFDVGSWSVPGDMVAQIHSGEMIIPAGPAAAIRNGGGFGGSGGSGGNAFTININAIDTQTGAQFLKNNASVIASTISSQVRNFNPRFAN